MVNKFMLELRVAGSGDLGLMIDDLGLMIGSLSVVTRHSS